MPHDFSASWSNVKQGLRYRMRRQTAGFLGSWEWWVILYLQCCLSFSLYGRCISQTNFTQQASLYIYKISLDVETDVKDLVQRMDWMLQCWRESL